MKWLGNDGTHEDRPSARHDVLDAMKVLDEVITAVFDRTHVDAAAIAKAVNKRKGSRFG